MIRSVGDGRWMIICKARATNRCLRSVSVRNWTLLSGMAVKVDTGANRIPKMTALEIDLGK